MVSVLERFKTVPQRPSLVLIDETLIQVDRELSLEDVNLYPTSWRNNRSMLGHDSERLSNRLHRANFFQQALRRLSAVGADRDAGLFTGTSCVAF